MEYNIYTADMCFGQEIEGFYILKEAHLKTSSSGKSFLSAAVSDQSGSIDCMVWDYRGPLGPDYAGRVVKLRGTVSEYRGFPQITASRIRPAQEGDEFELSRLVPVAPIDIPARMKEVEELAESIEDEDYRRIALELLQRHREAFLNIPAAKSVHHGFISGLLMHTSNMLRAADFLSGLYSEVIDRSLLLAGTLLHDFAKREEFSFSELGMVSDYSVKGQLLGHLVLGAQEVASLAEELGIPGEKSMLLQHLILSHHGEPQYGAAVQPLCAEAELLSFIDRMDSRMEIYAETLPDMEPGSVSGKIFSLEHRIYRRL